MNKLILWSTLAVFVTTTTCALMIHRRTESRLRDRRSLFEQQAGELAKWSAENQRLSDLVARMKTSRALSDDQLNELLRLRAEAGQLSQAGAEQKSLQAANEQLRETVAKSEHDLAKAQAAPNYWPRDQLSFAGNADPQSTVRTMLWAMNSGEVASWRSMISPEALADMERERKGKSEAEIEEEMKVMGHSLVDSADGFHVVDQREPAPNVAIVSLSFDGEGRIRKFVLQKIGAEWKIRDLLLEGQSEPEYTAGRQTN
jgi:hypothetical protein